MKIKKIMAISTLILTKKRKKRRLISLESFRRKRRRRWKRKIVGRALALRFSGNSIKKPITFLKLSPRVLLLRKKSKDSLRNLFYSSPSTKRI
jgi:hypothetical protein